MSWLDAANCANLHAPTSGTGRNRDSCPHFCLLVTFLIATFPATWLLMLFLGNFGTGLSYRGTLPVGILVSALLAGVSSRSYSPGPDRLSSRGLIRCGGDDRKPLRDLLRRFRRLRWPLRCERLGAWQEQILVGPCQCLSWPPSAGGWSAAVQVPRRRSRPGRAQPPSRRRPSSARIVRRSAVEDPGGCRSAAVGSGAGDRQGRLRDGAGALASVSLATSHPNWHQPAVKSVIAAWKAHGLVLGSSSSTGTGDLIAVNVAISSSNITPMGRSYPSVTERASTKDPQVPWWWRMALPTSRTTGSSTPTTCPSAS